jgi:hypothetical protein
MKSNPINASSKSAGRGVAAGLAAALLLGATMTPAAASAQIQTAWNEPVADWAQQSWADFNALKAAAGGGTQYKTVEEMPDWSGIWTHAGQPMGQRPTRLFDPTAMASVLTPRYKAAFLYKYYKVNHDGDEWDQLSDCVPSGFPRYLTEPFLREFILTPKETWWINEQVSEARRLYTDGRGHISADIGNVEPEWEGDSIAFWNKDTLVVHTLYVTHGQYQRQNPEYSTKTSVIEKLRKIEPDLIEDDITVYDPESLKQPWHDKTYYQRVTTPNIRIGYWSCDANNNVIKTPTGGSTFELPGENIMVPRAYHEPQDFYLTDIQKVLFNSNDPIVLTPEKKTWLKANLPDPTAFADILGPMTPADIAAKAEADAKRAAARAAAG